MPSPASAAVTDSPHPMLMTPSPPPPPRIPPGWLTGPPDFVGVGAQRAGTTWWWAVIHSHPDVALAGADPGTDPADNRFLRELGRRKELHFFDCYGTVCDLDPALYHRHFPRPPGRIVGEWTPRYMHDFWTPPMLHKAAPETKVLVMLRDPLERFLSGVAHGSMMAQALGFAYGPQPFVHHEHLSRGRYWSQLRNVLEYFDREQLLVLQYERCTADIDGQATRTFDFLGLDPGKWQLTGEARRPAGPPSGPRPLLDSTTTQAIVRAYQPELERLVADFPEIDTSLWPSLTR